MRSAGDDSDRGLSTVSGTILVVGVVVVLGSLVGVAAMAQADEPQRPPSVVFEFDLTERCPPAGQTLEIQHVGGGVVDTEQVYVQFEDVRNHDPRYPPINGTREATNLTPSETLRSGDSIEVGSAYMDKRFDDARVSLVWKQDDTSYLLQTWDASADREVGGGCVDMGELNPHWDDPDTKFDCMKGGYKQYGFYNQGLCIRFVNTGKDSRLWKRPHH